MKLNTSAQQILDKLQITALNAMQEQAYATILQSDKDVVLLSPTGSGKTLAYLLPLAERIDTALPEVQAVVIVPGRELALQSSEVLQKTGSGIRACSCYGGRAAMDEHKTLKQIKPQVIFATPGRLNDHLAKGNISAAHIRFLVIDEFDKCLEMGFREEMQTALSSLPNLRRRILLSATDAAEIPLFVRMKHTVRVNYLEAEAPLSTRIAVYQVRSEEKDKLQTLSKLLRTLGDESSIVFLNHRESVERTNAFLREEGFVTASFHGGFEQKEREAALYRFANGSANVFVCTDLGSRGLDIPDVNNVINYHLPDTKDAYIHRVGRTARWENEGRTFFLLGPSETLPSYIDEEPEQFSLPEQQAMPSQPRMTTIYIGKGKKDKISKIDVVGYLCKKGGLQKEEIGRIDVKDRYTYAAIARPKLKQVLRLTNGEKIKGIRTIVEEIR